MKKIVFLFSFFIFINTTNALNLEEQLTKLRDDYNELETRIDDMESTRLDKTYPIGSIFETTIYSTVNEVQSVMGGTWEEYGKGKTLIGVDSSDNNFNIVNKTGGNMTTTLTASNLPSHTHSIPALTGMAASAGAHTHTRGTMEISGYFQLRGLSGNLDNAINTPSGVFTTSRIVNWSGTHAVLSHQNQTPATYDTVYFNASKNWTGATSSAGAHTHSVTTTASTSGSNGSGTAFTNLPPYITVYMYKRVA